MAQGSAPDILRADDVLDGRFRIIEQIGEGGMGVVFAAEQVGLGRRVAIKTLSAEYTSNLELTRRFCREAKVVQQLNHPNTVRLYDFAQTADGLLFIVMEHLDGVTLDHVVHQRGRLPVQTVEEIGCQVLGALIEAHSLGVIHRDLKPSNLMLVNQLGARNLVKVLDFGLALADVDGVTLRTRTGAIMGTPHYMSPEQARGERVTPRSDLYSLSLTMYELVMGRAAYNANSPYEVAMCHLTPEPLILPDLLANTRLGAAIARAAEKDPEDRFADAESMLELLSNNGSLLAGPAIVITPRSRPAPAAETTSPTSSQPANAPVAAAVPQAVAKVAPNPLVLGVSLAACLCLLALGLLLLGPGPGPDRNDTTQGIVIEPTASDPPRPRPEPAQVPALATPLPEPVPAAPGSQEPEALSGVPGVGAEATVEPEPRRTPRAPQRSERPAAPGPEPDPIPEPDPLDGDVAAATPPLDVPAPAAGPAAPPAPPTLLAPTLTLDNGTPEALPVDF